MRLCPFPRSKALQFTSPPTSQQPHTVSRLHAAGIEVILDVVYNHTAELDDKNPYTISFR